jgi:hypothetical protein
MAVSNPWFRPSSNSPLHPPYPQPSSGGIAQIEVTPTKPTIVVVFIVIGVCSNFQVETLRASSMHRPTSTPCKRRCGEQWGALGVTGSYDGEWIQPSPG